MGSLEREVLEKVLEEAKDVRRQFESGLFILVLGVWTAAEL
jgi:hypothetical protein